MKGRFVALFVAGALASAAYAQSVSERTGVNAALGITPKTEDFIKEAAMSDMLEIEAAKIAQEKGNADIKKFAAHHCGRTWFYTNLTAAADAIELLEHPLFVT